MVLIDLWDGPTQATSNGMCTDSESLLSPLRCRIGYLLSVFWDVCMCAIVKSISVLSLGLGLYRGVLALYHSLRECPSIHHDYHLVQLVHQPLHSRQW